MILTCMVAICQQANTEIADPLVPPVVAKSGTTPTDTVGVPKNFIVSNIVISGNRKTKPYIIQRELTFREGDSVNLTELVKKFEYARQQLMNTKLFNEVIVSLKSFRGYNVDVQIDVKERWYLFPIPYFKPVDRNLSAWAEKHYSLTRVNYGLKFYWDNVTGRNDHLKFWLISGYTKQFQFSYDQPNADKSLKHGYGLNFSYSTAKEINTNTINNQQTFDTSKGNAKFLNEQLGVQVSWSYRPAIKTRHSWSLGVFRNKIDPSVLLANDHYFNNFKTTLTYPEFNYHLEYFDIDYIPYPSKGFMGDVTLTKRGINGDMNLWQVQARATRAWDLRWKMAFNIQAAGTLKLPFDQPYVNRRFMGYGDNYLRGMEKYVVDGVAGALFRNTLRRQLFDFNVRTGLSGSHNKIPFRIFVKTFADVGYSYNRSVEENYLDGKLLYTAGAGFDVLTFYDLVFRFEESVNRFGNLQFNFHVKNDF